MRLVMKWHACRFHTWSTVFEHDPFVRSSAVSKSFDVIFLIRMSIRYIFNWIPDSSFCNYELRLSQTWYFWKLVEFGFIWRIIKEKLYIKLRGNHAANIDENRIPFILHKNSIKININTVGTVFSHWIVENVCVCGYGYTYTLLLTLSKHVVIITEQQLFLMAV